MARCNLLVSPCYTMIIVITFIIIIIIVIIILLLLLLLLLLLSLLLYLLYSIIPAGLQPWGWYPSALPNAARPACPKPSTPWIPALT